MSKITTNSSGDKSWKNEAGEIHRVDGPAFIHTNGTQSWWVDGLHHRLDGPAFIGADGSQAWLINDINLTDQVKSWIKENDFSDYSLWTDAHKIMFRLAFSGV